MAGALALVTDIGFEPRNPLWSRSRVSKLKPNSDIRVPDDDRRRSADAGAVATRDRRRSTQSYAPRDDSGNELAAPQSGTLTLGRLNRHAAALVKFLDLAALAGSPRGLVVLAGLADGLKGIGRGR